MDNQIIDSKNPEDISKTILDTIRKNASRESVEMKLVHGNPGLINSKVSGIPFIPEGGEYPVDKVTGKKLFLLIQINFAEMPQLPDYPTEGILQIFIGGDDVYGVDFDDPQNQESWRILFFEDITNPMAEDQIILSMPEIDPDDMALDLPFNHPGEEYAIEFTKRVMPMSTNDFRFDDLYSEKINNILPDEYKSSEWYNITQKILDPVTEEINELSSRIGGYPGFTQQDPRFADDETGRYELLLQIDSEGDENDWFLMWGDSGIANFFIDPEDLKKRDFTRVYYNWDCC